VKAIATEKLGDIDRKIAELTGLRNMLGHLVENCHGDAAPNARSSTGWRQRRDKQRERLRQ
jgi:hypothetical protein